MVTHTPLTMKKKSVDAIKLALLTRDKSSAPISMMIQAKAQKKLIILLIREVFCKKFLFFNIVILNSCRAFNEHYISLAIIWLD
jgi:hypothetical protein